MARRPTQPRSRQTTPRRPVAASSRRAVATAPRRTVAGPAPAGQRPWRPRINLQAGVLGGLVLTAAILLIAATQGPGTVDLSEIRGARGLAIGDQAVGPAPSMGPFTLMTAPPNASPNTGSKEPEQLRNYGWPLGSDARITDFYGYRDEGFLSVDGRRLHEGIDIASRCGDSIRAAHAGTVIASGRRFGPAMGFSAPLDRFYARLERRGMYNALPIAVVIDDGNGYRSIYVHLKEAIVEKGDVVKRGQTIGYEGDTGNATGCHLHYEIARMDGGWMSIAKPLVNEAFYPPSERERVDPLRILSLDDVDAPRVAPGVDVPKRPMRLKASDRP